MSTDDLRQRYLSEIGAELGQPIEEFGEHPEEEDFNRVKERLAEDVEPGTPKAAALESVTWDDVRKYVYGG